MLRISTWNGETHEAFTWKVALILHWDFFAFDYDAQRFVMTYQPTRMAGLRRELPIGFQIIVTPQKN